MKKGFTLVELLAVIVILAIIITIAIPGISGIVKSATKNAFESDLHMVIKAIEYKKLEDDTFDPTTINESNVKGILNIDDSNYQTLTIKKINGILYVTIVGKNKWNNFTISGTKTTAKVNDTVASFSNGANVPVLATGMTPIKWNGSTWVDTTVSDTDWYKYNTTDKKWANARTEDGSMWVWVPRYIYKISSGWHTNTVGTIDIQFSKGVDDNWNKTVIGNINLSNTANASNNTWTNHPAFTFGNTELTGIWVSKFEVSSSNPAAANGGGNVTNLKAKSVPNVTSWRGITINNIFTVTRSMETDNTYGWGSTGNGIDTHMMKNTEWGTIAYLAQSSYGKNAEIWVNNSGTFITGCAGSSATAVSYTGCENTYDTSNGLQASTTGNIYGVYDASGGSWEYVASYVANGHSNLNYGSNLLSADSKYKDVYEMGSTDTTANNYTLLINKKGDALYEASSTGVDSTTGTWYGDVIYMPRTDNPWLKRGGHYYSTTGVGAFTVSRYIGGGHGSIGFRGVVLVSEGL